MTCHSFYKAHHAEYLRRATPRNPRVRQDLIEGKTY